VKKRKKGEKKEGKKSVCEKVKGEKVFVRREKEEKKE
jgi:hypothetical protein